MLSKKSVNNLEVVTLKFYHMLDSWYYSISQVLKHLLIMYDAYALGYSHITCHRLVRSRGWKSMLLTKTRLEVVERVKCSLWVRMLASEPATLKFYHTLDSWYYSNSFHHMHLLVTYGACALGFLIMSSYRLARGFDSHSLRRNDSCSNFHLLWHCL